MTSMSAAEADQAYPADTPERNPYGVRKGQTWEVRERWGTREFEVIADPRWDAVRGRVVPAVRTRSQRGNARSLKGFGACRFVAGPEPSDKARRRWVDPSTIRDVTPPPATPEAN